jgi:hypothetical protein
MTTVGKILVVLHLVMCILFMAFAGAVFTAQKNWKDEATKKNAELTKANQKHKDQQAEFDKERTNAAAKQVSQADQIARLTGEKTTLEIQVKALDADHKTLNVALDEERVLASLNGVEADERTKEAMLQRGTNALLYETREELIASLRKVSDEKFALDLSLEQLTQKHEGLLADLSTVKRFLLSKNLPTDPKLMIAQVTPPPIVDGLITEYLKVARGGVELVEISLGSDDGLSIGNKLTAYGKKGYLGLIRLTEVTNDKAVGIVVKDEKAKNVTIQKGDHVTTKL